MTSADIFREICDVSEMFFCANVQFRQERLYLFSLRLDDFAHYFCTLLGNFQRLPAMVRFAMT